MGGRRTDQFRPAARLRPHSHRTSDAPPGGVYVFVTTGIEDALAQAREAAKRQAGDHQWAAPPSATSSCEQVSSDEISIHLVPALFGAGTGLTETLPAHVELELADQVSAPSAVHLRYRVKRVA